MKIVLDTSIRPSCYCYTTRTVCHENVLLLHDTSSVCHENRAGHKYPSIVLLLHDTTVCVMKIVLDTSIRPSCYCYTTRTVCFMNIVLDTSIRPSCYCYATRTVCHENRAGHKYPSIVLLLHDTHSVS